MHCNAADMGEGGNRLVECIISFHNCMKMRSKTVASIPISRPVPWGKAGEGFAPGFGLSGLSSLQAYSVAQPEERRPLLSQREAGGVSQSVSEECHCFCYGEPSGKSPSSAFDLPGLGLGPSGRAEKGRCGPERRGFRGGDLPSTPPPVELVAEEAPQTRSYRMSDREMPRFWARRTIHSWMFVGSGGISLSGRRSR